jgi:peroxiredoxin
MAQLRRDYQQFVDRQTEVVTVGPEGSKAFVEYWKKNDLPFVGLPDPKHVVLKRFGQQIKIFKFGRMPAQVLIDRDGVARFVHYGHSMQDIPPTSEMLELIDGLNRTQGES